MLARSRERLDALECVIEHARGYACDVTDGARLDATIERVRAELGAPKVLVHNAVGGAFGTFLEIEPEMLNLNFQVNTMALLHLARRLAPAMIDAGEGAIIVTGNTSALRGKAKFAGATDPHRGDRPGDRAEGCARRVRRDRRRHRPRMDARDDVEGGGRPVLHPTLRDRGGGVARLPAGAVCVVVQRRDPAVRGAVVRAGEASAVR
jgi:hypothetical protein